jgi:hypothetical protein
LSRLRETLIKLGYVSQPHMAKALEVQALYGGSLQMALLEIGAVDEAHLQAALERACGVRNQLDFEADAPDEDALELLRPYEAESLRILPWRKAGKVLHLVVADPSNVVQFDKLQTRWNMRIQFNVVCEPRMGVLLERFYHIPCPEKLKQALEPAAPVARSAAKAAQDAPVVDPTRREAVITDHGKGAMPSLSIASVIELPPPATSLSRAHTMELLVPLEFGAQQQQQPAQQRMQPPAPMQPPPQQYVQAPPQQLAPQQMPPALQTHRPAPQAAAGQYSAMTGQPIPPEMSQAPPARAPDVSQVTNLFQLQLNEVTRREQVAPLAVAQLLRWFDRAAVLTVRRNVVSGWEAAGRGVNRADFESMKVGLNEPRNAFEPVAKGAIHMGPIEAFPANIPLIAAMGGTPSEHALIAPVKVKDRVVAMLYGEAKDEATLEASMKPVRNLAEMCGKTFLRLILLLREEKPDEKPE